MVRFRIKEGLDLVITICKMIEIYRAIKYLVEPIKSNVPIDPFSSTDISEEVNIPSVEGCEIMSLESCLSHGQG